MSLITPAKAKVEDFARPSFYLAGPIENANQGERTWWREQAAKALHALGFDAISPLGKENWGPRAIVLSDLRSIEMATGVLAWLPHDIVSVGTAMEIWHAAVVLNKPVLVWGQPMAGGNPWLLHCAAGIFSTLENALVHIQSYQWQYQDPLVQALRDQNRLPLPNPQ